MRASEDAPLVVTFVAIALVILASEVSYPPPPVVPASAPDDQFSGTRALALLRKLVGDGLPHPAGSAQNAVVRQRIIDHLTEWGYHTVEHRTESVRWDGQRVPLVNLMCRIEGTERGSAILLACHHDSVSAGPGAADDGAAVAATLEIARMLVHQPKLKHDLILLITDGEEFGLLGAHQFVRDHSWADDIAVVLNFEARGTSGPSMMFETSAQNYALVGLFAQNAPRPRTSSLFYEVYKYLPNDTDFTVFKQAGMQGLNFAFIGNVTNYHTPDDNVKNLDPRSLQHHGENAWALIRAIGRGNLNRIHHADNAVYFDLFGKFVVMWPERLTLPLALLAAALSFVGIARMLLSDPPAKRLPAIWTFPASLLVATIAARSVMAGLNFSPALSSGWPRNPAPIELAIASASLLALVGLTGFVPRGCDAAVNASCWIAFAAIALASAYALPGGSYFFIIPLALGGLVAVALSRTAWAALALVGWPIGLYTMCVPAERLFYDALGFQSPELLAIRLGILGAAIFPVLNRSSRAARLTLGGGCAVSFAACLAYAATC